MLQLNISQQDAQYRLNIHDSVLSLRTIEPQLRISTEQAKLDIHQQDGVLEIDQTGFYNAVGLKSASEMDRENAQKALNHLKKVVSQMIREGDSLSRLDTTIPRIAAAHMLVDPPEVTLVSIPPPTIRYTCRAPQISVQIGKLDIALQRGAVQENGSIPSVDLQMLRYPSVTCRLSGCRVDAAV